MEEQQPKELNIWYNSTQESPTFVKVNDYVSLRIVGKSLAVCFAQGSDPQLLFDCTANKMVPTHSKLMSIPFFVGGAVVGAVLTILYFK